MNDFYVYVFKYRGVALYVGRGRGSRINHVLSGCSHNKALNAFVAFGYNDKLVDFLKNFEDLTFSEAKDLEMAMIDKLDPVFNIQCGSGSASRVAKYLHIHKNAMFKNLKDGEIGSTYQNCLY